MKKVKILICSTLLCMLLISCQRQKTTTIETNDLKNSSPSFIYNEVIPFNKDTSEALDISNNRGNGDPFGVIWNKDNVSFDRTNEIMDFTINKVGDTYYGAELRTKGDEGKILYGYFSTEMKPSAVAGTASTFFTYTGPSEGNPHDEIDIEFLGKDTTKVQFNYFVNDIGGHEYMYDLGFDASLEFHTYGFYWDESRIIWYVDNIPVYGINGTVPSTPQRVYANFWSGNQENTSVCNWMGKLDDNNLPAKASYKKFSASYLNGWSLDVKQPELCPDYNEFISTPVSFNNGSLDVYNVEVNEDKTVNHITYTAVQQLTYKNVNSPLSEDLNEAEYVAMKIKNNSKDDYVKVRADVRSNKTNSNGITTINTTAWQDGEPTKTDLTYGGSFFDIEPLQESICIIKYYGLVKTINLMIDSAGRKDKETFAGDITVSGFGYYGTSSFVDEYVKLNKNEIKLKPGEEEKIIVEASGEVTYTVENPNIATVESDGTIKAVSIGTTTVTVTSGNAKSSCSVKVTNLEPKDEETLPIVSDDNDLMKLSNISWGNGTYIKEETNTYGSSTEAISLSKSKSGEGIFFNIIKDDKYEIKDNNYVEIFVKNINHVSSTNGETRNGIYLSIYEGNSKVGTDVKVYKSYNVEYCQDAGNGWLYYKLPLTLFGEVGSKFENIKIKTYANMDDNEFFYFDGLNIVEE